MGSFSIMHWLVVGGVVMILFGGGKRLTHLAGDAASAIKAFRAGAKEADETPIIPPIEQPKLR